jgi:hypothetical protein
MKAHPKRKGKVEMSTRFLRYGDRLNESPSGREIVTAGTAAAETIRPQ